ncbi:MAG: hypothetical protein IMF12_01850 [Proteobacteria bacterium]|nr:hypothetical protein [Pseudomonadota bacterium]
MTTIKIPVNPNVAQIYTTASMKNKQKIQILMNLLLQEFANSPKPLNQLMDEISDNAQTCGLTPEILESMLNDNN